MAIGVNGQFTATFEIDGKTDFLTDDDLEEFTIIEKAGNVLPEFILNFISEDDSLTRSLNEANKIRARIGKDNNSLIDIELSVTKLKTPKDGAERRYYETVGFISSLKYITDHNMQISDETSGIEAAITAFSAYFDVEGNLTSSDDSQRWIQHSMSDKAFVNNCIMHADLGASFPACAITADNKFILKDVLKDIKRFGPTPYDWKLTKTPFGPKDILYDSDSIVTSNSGLINNWLGYGRNLEVNTIESGEVNTIFEEPEAILAMTNTLDKDPDIDPRFGGSRIISSNVHAKYWESYNHNLISLVNLGKLELMVHISNDFAPIKPLDLIMFSEESNDSLLASGEYTSGLFICTGVIKTIQAQKTVTTLLLNRESFNRVRAS